MEILPATFDGIARAADLIRAGRLVAFPTETVYGLGADGLSAEAVRRIFRAKGRPADNPLILHLAAPDAIDAIAVGNVLARRLAARFWPGPLTLVLPRCASVPPEVTAGLDAVAIRQPDHPVALALLAAVGRPLAAPSANPAGRPSPTSAQHVAAELEGRIDAVLDGGPCRIGLESTVLDLTRKDAVILRPGATTAEQLAEVLGYLPAPPNENEDTAASPGVRHVHYRPRCRIRLFEPEAPPVIGARDGLLCFTAPESGRRAFYSVRPKSLEDWAHGLYALLRKADAAGVETLHVERPPARGIGLALRDRLARAAGEDDHGARESTEREQ
jgi:L-threonylcarbamoyladenylate synthase